MKDPAFLFYPGDYITGTMGMTFEEKGAYMELLMMQFSRGHMTSHMIGQVVGQLWDKIQGKFIKDEQGLWYNERIELEQNKRKSYVSSRSNNLTGKNQHSNNRKIIGHMESHMEDRNVNVNKSKKENGKVKDDKILMMPFSTLRFTEAWNNWKEYRKGEHKFQYKTSISEQSALIRLTSLADGDEAITIDIINYSMAQGYKGLYLENKINTKNNNNESDKKERRAKINRAVLENFS